MKVNMVAGGGSEILCRLMSWWTLAWIGWEFGCFHCACAWDLGPALLNGGHEETCPFFHPFPCLGPECLCDTVDAGPALPFSPSVACHSPDPELDHAGPPLLAVGCGCCSSALSGSQTAPLLSLWDQRTNVRSGTFTDHRAASSLRCEGPHEQNCPSTTACCGLTAALGPPWERKAAAMRQWRCCPHRCAIPGERAWSQRLLPGTALGPRRTDKTGVGCPATYSSSGSVWAFFVFCRRDWAGAREFPAPPNWQPLNTDLFPSISIFVLRLCLMAGGRIAPCW